MLIRDIIPQNSRAVGEFVDTSREEAKFHVYAHRINWKISLNQTNPKAANSKTRQRYELYKHAKTIREMIRCGGTWADFNHAYSRGHIKYDTDSTLTVGEAREKLKTQSVNLAEDFGVSMGRLSAAMSYEDSIRHEFALVGVAHLEGMRHSTQQLIKKAAGVQTLAEFAHCCAARILLPEPVTVEEALKSVYAKEWKAAMDKELAALIKFDCFDRVPLSQALKHGRLVKSKWVFRVKYDSDGSVQRFKARFVAKGFTQVPGTDYYETYSPVFSYTSLRMVLARAAAHDLQIDQWDLESSFVQQDIDVDHLYVECPKGYPNTMDDGVTKAALHLKKSLYGTVQAPRLLHKRLSKFLKSKGFKQLVSDQCVYVKGEGEDEVIVCTWVDDILMASKRNNSNVRENFDMDIRREFAVSPWIGGQAGWILNMKIVRDWEKGTLHVSQEAAIEKLANRFSLAGKNSAKPYVPMDPKLKLRKPAEADIVPKSEFDYMSAVGGLLYISLTTRPDISYSVGVISRYMACPSQEHVKAAKRIIQYLYRTKEFGIRYSREAPSESSSAPHVIDAPQVYLNSPLNSVIKSNDEATGVENMAVTYVDADLAGDADTLRSTTGFAIMMHGGVVSWLSKLQTTVALSTSEAETNGATELVKQICHMRLFLRELGTVQHFPTIVYEDNKAAIAFVEGKENPKKAKHYLMKVNFLKEKDEAGLFKMRKVTTDNQLADVFTKPLADQAFCRYRDWMGVIAQAAAPAASDLVDSVPPTSSV